MTLTDGLGKGTWERRSLQTEGKETTGKGTRRRTVGKGQAEEVGVDDEGEVDEEHRQAES